MLPEEIGLKDAQKIARENVDCYGLARKAAAEKPRYALRFMAADKMKQTAETLGLSEQVELGKYKVTAVSEAVGPTGIMAMMLSIEWEVEEVLYVGEGHAMVTAKGPPKKGKYQVQRKDGMKVPMYVKASNKRARDACKERGIHLRATDAEGEDKGEAEEATQEVVRQLQEVVQRTRQDKDERKEQQKREAMRIRNEQEAETRARSEKLENEARERQEREEAEEQEARRRETVAETRELQSQMRRMQEATEENRRRRAEAGTAELMTEMRKMQQLEIEVRQQRQKADEEREREEERNRELRTESEKVAELEAELRQHARQAEEEEEAASRSRPRPAGETPERNPRRRVEEAEGENADAEMQQVPQFPALHGGR